MRVRFQFAPVEEEESDSGLICSIVSIVCGCIAFLLLPPLFGLAGIGAGIAGTMLCNAKTLGIIGIALSFWGMVVGMVIGS